MKAGWQLKSLGEVCEVLNGGTPKTNVADYWGGNHLWVTPAEMGKRKSPYISDTDRRLTDFGLNDSSARLAPRHSVILSSRAPIGHLVINTEPMATNQGCKSLVPSKALNYKFLYYFLGSIVDHLNDLGTGATFKELSGGKLKSVAIPLPPLPEQQRIVAILDEAFAGLAVAAANAEKNLKNGREVFESYLDAAFTKKSLGWEESNFGDSSLLQIIDGDRGSNYPKKSDFSNEGYCLFLNTKNVRPDGFSFDETMFISEEKDKSLRKGKLKRRDVVLTTRGTIGNIAIYDDSVPYSDVRVNSGMLVFRPNEKRLLSDFLFELLRSSIFRTQVQENVSGAAQPQLPIGTIVKFSLPVPEDLGVQRQLVERSKSILLEIVALESIYRQKLDAIAELKQALLQKAFAGELTKEVLYKGVALPLQKIPQISSTDLHAGILAIAFQKHLRRGSEKTFGHVKSEKIAHLAEAWAGIDLDRTPVKDAAGPNDFSHFLKVESRAKKVGFFTFKKTGEGHMLEKGEGFDGLAARTKVALGDKLALIEKLAEALARMNTEQAEIFATAFAAWNNLLISQNPISDEAIVTEARENWHPNKLKIDRDKFFKAIVWMREQGFVPTGLGRKVEAKG